MSKKIVNTVKWAVLIIICISLIIVVASKIISALQNKPLPTVFGYGACFVVSGSMEPALSVNDIIIVKEASKPEINDMVLYQSSDSLVVHRVVELSEDGKTVITRGDANTVDDPPFNSSLIIGKVVGVIPALGQLIAFFKSPYGITALVSLGAIICITVYLAKQAKNKADATE